MTDTTDETAGDVSGPDGDLSARAGSIVRDGSTTIVVGFDGSDSSRGALVFAAGLASRGEAELVVVLVGEPHVLSSFSPGAAAADAEDALELEQVLRADSLNQLGDLGTPWRFERRDGDAADELLAVGREAHADLIVVGRSAGGLTKRVLGSVAGKLTREADRPVLVVP